MSGHSKWASIKHKKAAADAKRGKVFTKLIREISVAAREGGGDPETNPQLRTAVERAKSANMPSDNVEKAIKKGTGELPGVTYESCLFEGYGPGGVALIVETLTDNKNRASSEIRNIFSKKNGNMAGSGSVAWMFEKKGYILVDKNNVSEDDVFSIAVDAGAEDVKTEGDKFEVYTGPKELENVKKALKGNNIKWETAELSMIPNSTIKLEGDKAKQLIALIEGLEAHDDVQKVYANFDIPDEVLEKITSKE